VLSLLALLQAMVRDVPDTRILASQVLSLLALLLQKTKVQILTPAELRAQACWRLAQNPKHVKERDERCFTQYKSTGFTLLVQYKSTGFTCMAFARSQFKGARREVLYWYKSTGLTGTKVLALLVGLFARSHFKGARREVSGVHASDVC
jgi:hypothetical protein